MHTLLSGKETTCVCLATAALVGIAVVGWLVLGPVSVGIVLALADGMALAIQLDIYWRTARRMLWGHRQLESLISLLASTPMKAPLPNTGGYAGSADFLALVAEIVNETRPRLIVEASSGLSSIVCGYCLQAIGKGRVISLEHDERFAELNRARIKAHGLAEIVDIRLAPLTPHDMDGQQKPWYDERQLGDSEHIDMLIIDGPPGTTGPLARHPALPLLHDRLSETAVILVDDADREDERKAIALWQLEFPELSARFVATQKGACILRHTGG